MANFFVFVANLLNLCQRTLLMHITIAFRLLRNRTQMNFERKRTSKNQFLPILSETQELKLEKICQKFSSYSHFHPAIHNQTYLIIVSVR